MSILRRTIDLECRYLSVNHTHLQVEYTDMFGNVQEAWIPLNECDSGSINVFDDVSELEVNEAWAQANLEI